MDSMTERQVTMNFQEEPKSIQKRFGLWLLIPEIIVIIVLFIFAKEWKGSLQVQRVVVSGVRLLPASDVYGWAKVPMKSALFAVPLADIYARVSAQPFIRSVSVSRQLPDAVLIQVAEREPIASLNMGQMYFVDGDGVLLPYRHTETRLDVPVISGVTGIERPNLGEIALSNELFQAIEVLKTARDVDPSLYRVISEINMNNGDDILLFLVDGGVPITLGRGDIAKKLVTFHSFMNDVLKKEDPKKLRSIDLRFDEQVVVKWDQKTERYPKTGSL